MLDARRSESFVLLDERRRGTSFLEVPLRSALNSPASTHMGFWSLNPYVGCEFGCTYCYARDTHRYTVERALQRGRAAGGDDPAAEIAALPPWEAFERRILVKADIAAVLARTLDPRRLAGQPLVIGTATDPYQPAERRFGLTRRVLESLGMYRGLSIGLITKSPLITRDLDVLSELATRHQVTVNISLATLDGALARRLEARTPMPHARLRALRRLTEAGIHAGLLIAPIVPGITDDRDGLDRLIAAARQAGARFVSGDPLRLGPAARARFLPHLAREFPDLADRYRHHYADRDQVSRAYQRALARRIDALRRRHGFAPATTPSRASRTSRSARSPRAPRQAP